MIQEMKKDIFNLFQDERIWDALTLLSDDSHSGDHFIKSEFLITEFSNFRKKVNSPIFLNLIKKYKDSNFEKSLLKLIKIIEFIDNRINLSDDKKIELFTQDLKIVEKKTLLWYQSKIDKSITLETIQSNSQLKEKFNDHCAAFWFNKMNKLLETIQSQNYYSFEDKIYTNRHLSF